jgi:hypothetical protein
MSEHSELVMTAVQRRMPAVIKNLVMSSVFTEATQQSPPYTINLGVELIAITDVYPLKTSTLGVVVDTEYLELILLKKSFFDKVINYGAGALIRTSESS